MGRSRPPLKTPILTVPTDPVVEIVDIDQTLEEYLDASEEPTHPRVEAESLNMGVKLQESLEKIGKILTSTEGVQNIWGRVELTTEIRRMRSILDDLEELIRSKG